MLRLLIQTELQYFYKYLLLAVAANLLFIGSIALWSSAPAEEYPKMAALMFVVFLSLYGGEYGNQKRKRLHAILPVTRSEAFFAEWILMVIILLIHAGFWISFTLMIEPDMFFETLLGTPEFVLHILLMIAVVTIGINLFTYQPWYLAWCYISGITLVVIGLAVIEARDLVDLEALGLLRLLRLLDTPWDLLISSATLAALVSVDHYVFTHNENFLGG